MNSFTKLPINIKVQKHPKEIMAELAAERSPFKIETVEMHTCGDPVRIIVSGYPTVQGDTILQKRSYVTQKLDHLRKAVFLEPRGHKAMYGALLVEPDHPDADLAALLIHTEGYSLMCGHATLSLLRYAVDAGFVQAVAPETPVNLQLPCGLVRGFVQYDDRTKLTGGSRFLSVPSFVYKSDVTIDVAGYGEMTIDICYGGTFYALVSADKLGLDIRSSPIRAVNDAAMAVYDAARDTVPLHHPDNPDLSVLYGTVVTDNDRDQTTGIAVCFGSLVVRSPCGSGVTTQVALQFADGRMKLGEAKRFYSGVTGTHFVAKAVERTKVGDTEAVVIEIAGRGNYIGQSKFFCEADDEVGKTGFDVEY